MLSSKNIVLANPKADTSAKLLMSRIREIPEKSYAFGHQDATAYGIGWNNNGALYRSDVNEVAGDFPGVYGFDLGHIELGRTHNLDSVDFGLMSKLIKKAYASGGIVTLSWHPDNPMSLKSTWDLTPAVPEILQGGSLNSRYQAWLTRLADFMKDLKTTSGDPTPIVFRPYHEMNGDWFWWGSGSCSPDQYKQLWRETFDFLTKTHELHNLIFCYATDAVVDEAEYLRFYPGDDVVDMLGIDLYHKETTEQYVELLNTNLNMLAKLAKLKNMPYALTEGGLEALPIENWWTEVLDKNIRDKGIAWALVWRNANQKHYYAPYVGQKTSDNFKRFKMLDHTYFLNEIKKIR